MAGIPVEALTDRYTVSYAPSGTVFAKLDRGRRPRPTRLLAVGDPTFAPPAGGPGFAPLPNTRHEVNALAALFADRTVFIGNDATEANLRQLAETGDLAKYQVLHFATHGQIDPLQASRCALILAHAPAADLRPRAEAGRQVNDGRLTAAEILTGWRLDADLVTLSACETGLGQEGNGEGLMGFSQVLLLRGARSVLVSLWPVSDAATTLLMVRFHENWLGTRGDGAAAMTRAEALREAKHWLRNLTRKEAEERLGRLPDTARGLKLEPADPQATQDGKPFAHPYYWSAFVLVGDAT
jgi:CHAT domain-containing protein